MCLPHCPVNKKEILFSNLLLTVYFLKPGTNIQKLTDTPPDDPSTSAPRSVAEKTAMVRAARQLLSAITKVLILADKVVVKQVIAAKDKVSEHAQLAGEILKSGIGNFSFVSFILPGKI